MKNKKPLTVRFLNKITEIALGADFCEKCDEYDKIHGETTFMEDIKGMYNLFFVRHQNESR